jgi:RNA polymerase sigma-70 factor, ECF subfamily
VRPRPAADATTGPLSAVRCSVKAMSLRSDIADRDEVVARHLDQHRPELTVYCYRMLGSVFDADDAVQETMVRGWRGMDGFEGRSAVRAWLYRIATNVCLDMLRGRQRRAQPMDLGPAWTTDAFNGAMLPGHAWLQPFPDGSGYAVEGDPASVAESRDTIRLAFVSALQHLPPRQRVVLILRDVLNWQAAEVAELLGTSVASVTSALQRARATMSARGREEPPPDPLTADHRALLARYVDAFERFDISTLVTLLRDDAVMSMPPYNFWLRGPAEIARWFAGPGSRCACSRLVPTTANGCAAFGSYRQDGKGGHEPFAIQVIEVSGGRIAGHHNFVDASLFAAFGLPARLP